MSTGAQPYQIPTASTGSLTRVGTAGATNPVVNEPTSRGVRRFSDGSPTLEDIPSRMNRGFSEGPQLRTYDPSASSMYRKGESPSNRSVTTRGQDIITPSSADTLRCVGKQPLSPTPSTDSAPPPYSRLQFREGEVKRDKSMASNRRDNTYIMDHVSPIHPYATVCNSQIPTSPIVAAPVPPPGHSPVLRPQPVSTPELSGHYPNGLHHSQEGVDSRASFPHVEERQTLQTIVV